jgi:hypothetical protein
MIITNTRHPLLSSYLHLPDFFSSSMHSCNKIKPFKQIPIRFYSHTHAFEEMQRATRIKFLFHKICVIILSAHSTEIDEEASGSFQITLHVRLVSKIRVNPHPLDGSTVSFERCKIFPVCFLGVSVLLLDSSRTVWSSTEGLHDSPSLRVRIRFSSTISLSATGIGFSIGIRGMSRL